MLWVLLYRSVKKRIFKGVISLIKNWDKNASDCALSVVHFITIIYPGVGVLETKCTDLL